MMHEKHAECQIGTDLHPLPALAVPDIVLRERDKECETSTPRMISVQLAARTPGKGVTHGSLHSASLVDAP